MTTEAIPLPLQDGRSTAQWLAGLRGDLHNIEEVSLLISRWQGCGIQGTS